MKKILGILLVCCLLMVTWPDTAAAARLAELSILQGVSFSPHNHDPDRPNLEPTLGIMYTHEIDKDGWVASLYGYRDGLGKKDHQDGLAILVGQGVGLGNFNLTIEIGLNRILHPFSCPNCENRWGVIFLANLSYPIYKKWVWSLQGELINTMNLVGGNRYDRDDQTFAEKLLSAVVLRFD